jgi:serine/threonine-protein kinase
MLELRLLGGLDLRRSDGPAIRSIIAQPKRFALLVYLALANSHQFRRRDSVVALFWPELSQENARNALRQALWFLRRALGEGVIVGRGDEELGVDPRTLRCDATEFDLACGARRWGDALELYRGDFLEGFFVSEAAPELERWVEEERHRLRHLAAEVAWELARDEASAGRQEAAAELGRRAAALQPDDEAAVRRLIRLLDGLGDRTGAVRVYEEFASRLARDLDLIPAPETSALITAVRSRHEAVPVADRHVVLPGSAVPPVGGTDREEGRRSPAVRRRRPWSSGKAGVLGAALGLAALAAVGWWPRSPTSLDPQLVAVTPFRISGSDSALGYLREGMVDLLAAALTGGGGPRAVDPRAVLHAYHGSTTRGDWILTREALGVAQQLGAGRVIDGGVVGTRDHLVLTASLLSVPGGRTRATARAEGPADSIAGLVDRLAGQLLAGDAGEEAFSLAELTSLPALRAYLSGQAAVRDGRSWDAVREFDRALQVDSGFALAAIGLATASSQVAGADVARGWRLAWAGRSRLSARDRALLTAQVGPRYPALATQVELLAAAETLVRVSPDRPEAWYALGEAYFHLGSLLGLSDTRARAADLFMRAFAMDSSRGALRPFIEPLDHLADLAMTRGDTVAARRWVGLVLADSSREGGDYFRWHLALATGDTSELRSLRARFEGMDEASLSQIMQEGQLRDGGIGDAERAAGLLERRFGTEQQRGITLFTLRFLALNLGRPSRAVTLTDEIPDRQLPHLRPLLKVMDRLFWDGDSAAAEQGVRQVTAFMQAPVPSDLEGRATRATDLCALGLWWVHAGDLDRAASALSRHESVAVADSSTMAAGNRVVCRAMLEASLATARRLPTARALAARLDSILLTGPPTVWISEATLVSARLQAALGDHTGALRALRRFTDNWWQTYYLSTFLREEGREAALVGDTAGAVRAYRRYLALRSAPEPGLRSEADRVREELLRLEPSLTSAGAARVP